MEVEIGFGVRKEGREKEEERKEGEREGREADYAMGPRFMGFFVALGDHPKKDVHVRKEVVGVPQEQA